MPITKEVKLEDGSRRMYHKTILHNGKHLRRIYLEDAKGNVFQVVYSDNQKRHAVVLKSISQT